MNYKLMVVFEREDGSLLKQWIKTFTEEESTDNDKVRRAIRDYKNRLGEGYYLIDYYFMY